MSEQASTEKKYKIHTFNAELKSTGQHTCDLKGEDNGWIEGTPPPVFGGETGKWSPEDLMLSAVQSCLYATFASYCDRKNFIFSSYESTNEGSLEHDGNCYSFVAMTIRPKIGVTSEDDIDTAIKYIHKAHKFCHMAYSVKADITVEPEAIVTK